MMNLSALLIFLLDFFSSENVLQIWVFSVLFFILLNRRNPTIQPAKIEITANQIWNGQVEICSVTCSSRRIRVLSPDLPETVCCPPLVESDGFC